MIEASVRLIWPGISRSRRLSAAPSGFMIWGPILITRSRLAAPPTTAAVLIGLWAFLTYTKFGRILRAGSRDPEMVGLLGIKSAGRAHVGFRLGCGISGIAGVLSQHHSGRKAPSMATNAIMPAFVVVAIGGLGSFAGAVIAGLLVGLRPSPLRSSSSPRPRAP